MVPSSYCLLQSSGVSQTVGFPRQPLLSQYRDRVGAIRDGRIQRGELLLFETTGFTNGKTLWETDVTGFRQKADDNFARLLGLQ